MQSFFYRTVLASTALCCLPCIPVQAAPTGGTVSAGSATIGQIGNITTITQGSDRAAIDWNSFNVGTGERVDFKQPSANAITFNRIHDQNQSSILGSITANGTVILSNPSGMIFGKNSNIDVGGLVATTSSIGNDAFMSGSPLKLTIPGNTDAKIIANGSITAKDAGLVAFLAPNVENNGIITARLGKVQLAGAETATLDMYGDGLVSIAVTDNATETSVKHTGSISASYVALTAADAAHLIDSTVNVNGIIDANDARVEKDGALTFGGKIEIAARDVTLDSHARLRATGKDGGGIVKVGGGWQGKGTITNAQYTTVKSGARINASATDHGDGGTVAVWSDDTTKFDGIILAKGGTNGGNGGHIETSGKINLGISGTADASSPWGTAGEWLLDPRDVRIQNNAVAGVENNVPGGGGTVNAPSDNYLVSAESIGAALSAGNNVTITTGTTGTQTGNLIIGTANINSSSATNVTLTLKADASITTSGTNSITGGASGGAGKLNVILWSDANVHDMTVGGQVALINTAITSNGGDIFIGGGADDGTNGGVAGDGRPDNFARGFAAGNSRFGVYLSNGDLNSGAGSITIRGQGYNDSTLSSIYGVYVNTGSLVQTTGEGNISIFGNGGNGTNSNAGVAIAAAGSSLQVVDGDVAVTGVAGNGTTTLNVGIQLSSTGTIASLGTGASAGKISLDGTGGTGTSSNHGIYLVNTGANITTVDGKIYLRGKGGNASTNLSNGIALTGGAAIRSTGTGAFAADIEFNGTGGTAGTVPVNSSDGYAAGISINTLDSTVETVDGDIIFTGDSRGTQGTNNNGMTVGGTVRTTGTGPSAGNILLTGTGSTSGGTGSGVRIGAVATGAGLVSTVDGSITINAVATPNSDVGGVFFGYDSTTSVTGTGNLSLTAKGGNSAISDITAFGAGGGGDHNVGLSVSSGQLTLNIDRYVQPVSTLILSAPTIVIAPRNTNIDIGIAGETGLLNIPVELLDHMTTNHLIIGRTDGIGQINVGAYTWDDPVEFKTSAPGLIILHGTQQGIPGSDASMTFSGPARTYYDIDFTGTTGSGVTFNGPRDQKSGGSGGSSSGSGSNNENPLPVSPEPENPGAPVTPPAGNPEAPNTPQSPAAGSINRDVLSTIISQEDNTYRQPYNAADLGNFKEYLQRHYDESLYSFDPELEEKLSLK